MATNDRPFLRRRARDAVPRTSLAEFGCRLGVNFAMRHFFKAHSAIGGKVRAARADEVVREEAMLEAFAAQ